MAAGSETGRPRSVRARFLGVDNAAGWALVSPGAILIGIFGLLPVLMSLKLSFQQSDLLSPQTPWVGTDNYQRLFDDPQFVDAVKNTIIYTVLYVPGTMLVGLLVAAALNRSIRFISVYRTRGVRHHGRPVDHLAGHHLPVVDRPGLRPGERGAGHGGDCPATVPVLAVAGAVRHRRDDDLGLDGFHR